MVKFFKPPAGTRSETTGWQLSGSPPGPTPGCWCWKLADRTTGSDCTSPSAICSRWASPRDVAVQLRVPAIDDFNCGYNEGVGYLHVNQKRGRRWSSAGGFLKPAIARSNLRRESHVLLERHRDDGRDKEPH
jgi:hypothetical protein